MTRNTKIKNWKHAKGEKYCNYEKFRCGTVAHPINPGYLGGRDRRIESFQPAGEISMTLFQKKKTNAKGLGK
jgi:hypothetical protein